jgi:long-chain acyl-CoA synthetase
MTDIVTRLREAGAQLLQVGGPHELNTVMIDGVSMPVYASAPQTLREALDAGRAHGDKTFVVYEAESWTFCQFFALAVRMGLLLVSEFGIV